MSKRIRNCLPNGNILLNKILKVEKISQKKGRSTSRILGRVGDLGLVYII